MTHPSNDENQSVPPQQQGQSGDSSSQFAPPSGAQQPQYGQQAPQYGQQAPQYGQQAPQYGQQAPQYGQQAPQYGQQAPQYGQQTPQYGQQPSQYGTAPAGYGNFRQNLKPGIIPLKPLGLGEIYDGAFSAVRKAPGTILGLVGIVVSVFVLIAGVFGYIISPWLNSTSFGRELDQAFIELGDAGGITSIGSAGLLGITGVISIAMVLATALATGIVVVAIGQLVINREVTPGQVWDKVRPRAWALVGVAIVPSILVALVLLAGFALVALLVRVLGEGAVAIVVLYTIAAVIGAIYFSTKVMFAPAVLILEERGVIASIKRSFAITKRSFWRVFGIYLLTNIILQFTVGVVAQVLMALVGSVTGNDIDTNVVALAGWLVVQILTNIVVVAIMSSVLTLMYVDLRMRKEGLDIELLAAAEKAS